jgi:hypothetical protein
MEGPDIYFVQVACTMEQYENDSHYEAAWEKISADHYVGSPYVVIDETDPGKAVMQLFAWETASTVTIEG